MERTLKKAGHISANITLILGVILFVSFVRVSAQDPGAKDLRKFYHDNCVGCHGADGSAINQEGKKLKGEDFTDPGWQKSTSDKKMVKVIMKGIFFGMAMPGFKDSLTEEEAQQIVTDIIRKSKKGEVIYKAADNPETMDNLLSGMNTDIQCAKNNLDEFTLFDQIKSVNRAKKWFFGAACVSAIAGLFFSPVFIVTGLTGIGAIFMIIQAIRIRLSIL